MWVRTLVEGGQQAEDVASDLVDWLGAARESLDLALYDLRLPGAVGDQVGDALRAARDRGVQVRIAFNQDEPEPEPRPFEPPPPRTEPSLLEQLGVPLRPIPGWRDLMHHKYVVRDGAAVWTGSTNWTLDSWEREENVLVAVESPALAAAYARNFAQLWERGHVGNSRQLRRRDGRAACGRGSAPGAGRSSRNGSPSGSGPRSGGCGSPRRC